jgi:hypothetical protein
MDMLDVRVGEIVVLGKMDDECIGVALKDDKGDEESTPEEEGVKLEAHEGVGS